MPKDFFGRRMPFATIDISGYEGIIQAIVDQLADAAFAAVSLEEIEELASNKKNLYQYVVGEVNKILNADPTLLPGIPVVNGDSIGGIIDAVLSTRIDAFYINITISQTGLGSVSNEGRYRKGSDVDLIVTGNVVSCSETIVDNIISLTDLQSDAEITIVFENPPPVE